MRTASFGFFIHFCFIVSISSGTILWKPLSVSFPDLPAKFAVDVGSSGLCGALYVADPPDACSPIRSVLETNETRPIKFTLVVRGQCTFEDKIRNAQNGGFNAAIVYNDRDNGDMVYMMVDRESVKIHSMFVSHEAGVFLMKHARGENGECCLLQPYKGGTWTVLAISLLSLTVIVAFLIIAFVTPRRWTYWRGRNYQPRSLDSKIVEALPCFVFCSASSNQCHGGETCAICLEDYKDGENLKALPCKHEFHSSCVDSWLTKWGTFCPVCKLDVRNNTASNEVHESSYPLFLYFLEMLILLANCSQEPKLHLHVLSWVSGPSFVFVFCGAALILLVYYLVQWGYLQLANLYAAGHFFPVRCLF